MKTHELKTDPAVFQATVDGARAYEIRRNDRGFNIGDELVLRETKYTGAEMSSGASLVYTGREIIATVTHVLNGPIYGLMSGWCILSVQVKDKPLKVAEDENDWHKKGEFPPVGSEFEFSYKGLSWVERVMLFNDGITCLMAHRKYPANRRHYKCDDSEMRFRPIQAERERWVAAAQQAIGCEPNAHRHMLGQLYDAALAKMPEGEGDENS